MLRIRIEDKGPYRGFSLVWRAREEAALACHRGVAEAGRAGLLAGGGEGFARVIDGLLRAAR